MKYNIIDESQFTISAVNALTQALMRTYEANYKRVYTCISTPNRVGGTF